MAAKVPANLFGSSSNTVKPQNVNTVLPQGSETVEPLNGETVKPQKVSFYLETELHLDKLDDLVRLYRKKTGRRINRQDVVRKLIENSSIESIL